MRKNTIATIATLVLAHLLFVSAKTLPHTTTTPVLSPVAVTYNDSNSAEPTASVSLFEKLNLGGLGLSKEAYDYAVAGQAALRASGKLTNGNVLSIVDFSKPSSKKRLFIIDLKKERLLFNTYVAHGRGSGREMAREFSNMPESNKSSLGFYVTGDTYMGKHGFSLRLLGEEKGINDNANSRAIVMHSAAYVTEEAIKMQGFIGRSLGCPALPEALTKPIIETIKNGSCLFMYSPDNSYLTSSSMLKRMVKA